MRRFQILLLFIAISCSMFAQDRLSLFIGRANKYASVELSDYRKRLCVEYNMSNNSLDDYYRRCGRNWGNVVWLLKQPELPASTCGMYVITINVITDMAGIVFWQKQVSNPVQHIITRSMTGFIIIVTVGMNIIARIVIITINTIISIIKNINTTNIINS